MSTQWTHPICERCWRAAEGPRLPARITPADPERCCFCAGATRAGIYVRRDPTTVPCRGDHPMSHVS